MAINNQCAGAMNSKSNPNWVFISGNHLTNTWNIAVGCVWWSRVVLRVHSVTATLHAHLLHEVNFV